MTGAFGAVLLRDMRHATSSSIDATQPNAY